MDREELEDAVAQYVLRNDESPDRAGVHVIPYGDVFIALETRVAHPTRYLGWFYPTDRLTVMNGWVYLGMVGNCHLYQNEADYRELEHDTRRMVREQEVEADRETSCQVGESTPEDQGRSAEPSASNDQETD